MLCNGQTIYKDMSTAETRFGVHYRTGRLKLFRSEGLTPSEENGQ
jgi:hypothetical protein